MYILSEILAGASKLWGTKDFGVEKIQGGSPGTNQILHFQNKNNYTKTSVLLEFLVLLGLDNMVIVAKFLKKNFVRFRESYVLWSKYQRKASMKRLNRSPFQMGLKKKWT